MSDLVAKLKILLRAEKTLYRADASRRANAMVFSAVAAGCVIVALVFANMALFFVLTEATVAARAAFMLAALNLLLATIPVQLARRIGPGKEEAMLQELRDLTLDEVTRELEQVGNDVTTLGVEVKALLSGDTSVSGKLHALGPALSFVTDLLNDETTAQVSDNGPAKQRDPDL